MARLAFAMAALIGTVVLGNAAIAANAAVAMRGAQFAPSAVTVNVGDSVTWTNEDGIAHSARADNSSFDTGIFSTGTRSATFGQAGTFGYFCAVHPSTMRGTVNVIGAATPPPPTPPPPTTAPTVRPSPPPPTSVPTTPSPSPVPAPTASPAATSSAAPTAAPSPTSVALQISPTPSATATPIGSSQSGDGAPPLLLLGAVAAVLALAGAAFALSRRGQALARRVR